MKKRKRQLLKGGPLEITTGGVTIPKKNSCKGNLSKKNKLYALEKIPADKRAFKKNSSPPPDFSNGPSLKKTSSKPEKTHAISLVVCYTAVFRVVTQPFSWGGALRDDSRTAV